MLLRLIFGTIGVSAFLSALFFILGLKRKSLFDWDGIIERALIVVIFTTGGPFYFVIPVVIAIRILFYLNLHSFVNNREPAMEFQKIKFKTEMLLDLILSPVLAVFICLII